MGFWNRLGEFLFFSWLFGNHSRTSCSDNSNSLINSGHRHYDHDDLHSEDLGIWHQGHGHSTDYGHGTHYGYDFDDDYRSYDDFLDEHDDYDMMDDDF